MQRIDVERDDERRGAVIADSSGRFTPAIASRPLATVANATVDDVPALLSEPDTPFTKNVVAAEAVDANERCRLGSEIDH